MSAFTPEKLIGTTAELLGSAHNVCLELDEYLQEDPHYLDLDAIRWKVRAVGDMLAAALYLQSLAYAKTVNADTEADQ